MFPSDVEINSDVTYTVCVQFGQFIAKFDDGSCVLVPHKYDEWVVDYQRCSLASLQKDFAARVNWGSNQEVEVSVFDKSINLETRLENDSVLRAFFDRKSHAKQGRPLGSASTCTPKRQKVVQNESTNISPGPVTRSQSALSTIGEGSSQEMATPKRQQVVTNQSTNISPVPVTRRQLALSMLDESTSQELATPSRATKSPSKPTSRIARKITPRKFKK
ncbi:hypothetical protein ZEAMMB73_Zm00001d013125 [Zea mays]|uniref:Uncharacterized protein n=1 Tax=Zea mays TaxID=4577 RepID=A0A1D6GG52_MAIZE|nr:hypothetical protein ZEAMMB73_Zm00001d013125 [Zea mays]